MVPEAETRVWFVLSLVYTRVWLFGVGVVDGSVDIEGESEQSTMMQRFDGARLIRCGIV